MPEDLVPYAIGAFLCGVILGLIPYVLGDLCQAVGVL